MNWRGTADVLRQVEVLNALDGTAVPHCSVRWSGADLTWFGCPYFVVPQLEGDVLRLGQGEWGAELADEALHDLGSQAMGALARIHKVDPAQTPYLGDPVPFAEDVERWDRFYQRAADPEALARAPECRQRLLDTIPHDAPVGIFHGDFQTANLFCSKDAKLLAVIDWELTGVGATLNDVGWICTFSDPKAWAGGRALGRPDVPRSGHLGIAVYGGVRRPVAGPALVSGRSRPTSSPSSRGSTWFAPTREAARPELGADGAVADAVDRSGAGVVGMKVLAVGLPRWIRHSAHRRGLKRCRRRSSLSC